MKKKWKHKILQVKVLYFLASILSTVGAMLANWMHLGAPQKLQRTLNLQPEL
jgi:hypothetical protein